MREGNLPDDPKKPTSGSKRWFVGHRTEAGCRVLVWDGMRHRPLSPMLNMLRKSPDGFEWGYGGSGPAQLAFAIVYAVLQSEEEAIELYQEFKFKVIGRLEKRAWTMSESEVEEAIARIRLSRQEDSFSLLFDSARDGE